MTGADLRAADGDEIRGFAAAGAIALAAIAVLALRAAGGGPAIEYVAAVQAGLLVGSRLGERAWIWAVRDARKGDV